MPAAAASWSLTWTTNSGATVSPWSGTAATANRSPIHGATSSS